MSRRRTNYVLFGRWTDHHRPPSTTQQHKGRRLSYVPCGQFNSNAALITIPPLQDAPQPHGAVLDRGAGTRSPRTDMWFLLRLCMHRLSWTTGRGWQWASCFIIKWGRLLRTCIRNEFAREGLLGRTSCECGHWGRLRNRVQCSHRVA